jgi:filamentous hemagglutinin family protein
MARRRGRSGLLGLAVGATLLWPLAGSAEVVTDGTLGAKVRLTGRDVKIPARLGQTRGQNLFHSFERFGVPTKGQVTFTGPDGLKNVIARVTGGEPSTIDGTLASRVPRADVWLLNPAGILFGPNARLDVPASFHASTADALRFADGKVFSALDPGSSVLSVAAPEAFGFLRAKPAGISVKESVLDVKARKALSLVGGDITVRGNGNGAADEPGTVRARAGRVSLAALGGPGTVAAGSNEATGVVSGNIHLTGEASLVASGNGGGSIRIRGGRLVVEGASSVLADNLGGAHAAGGIAIVTDTLEIRDGGLIRSSTFGRGYAGSVTVAADTVDIRGGGAIRSSTRGKGDAGEVTVTAMHHLRIGSLGSAVLTGIVSNAVTGSSGGAGSVTVAAGTIDILSGGVIRSATQGTGRTGEVTVTARGDLRIDAADVPTEVVTGIASRADDGPTGNAGRVAVKAGTIELRRGGVIRSSTIGQGDAGDMTVTARGELRIDGDGSQVGTGIASAADFGSRGNAGRLTVKADTIDIRGSQLSGGGLDSSSEGRGNAGTVVAKARTIAIRNEGLISSRTLGSGNAGEVRVKADHLTIDGTGTAEFTGISSAAAEDTFGQPATGDAGRVLVRAGTIELRGSDVSGGGLNSTTHGPGHAGEVVVDAGTLEIGDGGLISSASRGDGGDGGEVRVKAGHLTIDATGPEGPGRSFTGINTRAITRSAGDAGRVAVEADTLAIRGGGAITSSNFGSGDAGNVAVRAVHLELRDASEISSSATGSGRAGNVRVTTGTLEVEDASIRTVGEGNQGGRIAVTASDLIHLHDAEVTSNGIEPSAGRSVIRLEAPLIVLNASRVTSLTGARQPLEGSGLAQLLGEVTVISPESFVAASSSVTLTGVEGDVGSRLAVPEGVFLNVGDLLRESCAARRTGKASSFTAMGGGGRPPDPAGPLAGAYHEPGGGTAADQTGPVLAGTFGDGCEAAPGG